MKIEVGKKYITRNGTTVLIYAIDANKLSSRHQIHGAIENREHPGNWNVDHWYPDGKWSKMSSYTGSYDIIKPFIEEKQACLCHI